MLVISRATDICELATDAQVQAEPSHRSTPHAHLRTTTYHPHIASEHTARHQATATPTCTRTALEPAACCLTRLCVWQSRAARVCAGQCVGYQALFISKRTKHVGTRIHAGLQALTVT